MISKSYLWTRNTRKLDQSFVSSKAYFFALQIPTNPVTERLINLFKVLIMNRSCGSSGNVLSDCGLDDRGSIPDGAEDFSSSPCVQTGSGAHPASYPMGTGEPFPGVKRGRSVKLTTHPHIVSRLSMSRS
jgi:hypothetical protein